MLGYIILLIPRDGQSRGGAQAKNNPGGLPDRAGEADKRRIEMENENFRKGVLDFIRQQYFGNFHALINALEGEVPDDTDEQANEDFVRGFEFARRVAECEEPSQVLQREIRERLA